MKTASSNGGGAPINNPCYYLSLSRFPMLLLSLNGSPSSDTKNTKTKRPSPPNLLRQRKKKEQKGIWMESSSESRYWNLLVKGDEKEGCNKSQTSAVGVDGTSSHAAKHLLFAEHRVAYDHNNSSTSRIDGPTGDHHEHGAPGGVDWEEEEDQEETQGRVLASMTVIPDRSRARQAVPPALLAPSNSGGGSPAVYSVTVTSGGILWLWRQLPVGTVPIKSIDLTDAFYRSIMVAHSADTAALDTTTTTTNADGFPPIEPQALRHYLVRRTTLAKCCLREDPLDSRRLVAWLEFVVREPQNAAPPLSHTRRSFWARLNGSRAEALPLHAVAGPHNLVAVASISTTLLSLESIRRVDLTTLLPSRPAVGSSAFLTSQIPVSTSAVECVTLPGGIGAAAPSSLSTWFLVSAAAASVSSLSAASDVPRSDAGGRLASGATLLLTPLLFAVPVRPLSSGGTSSIRGEPAEEEPLPQNTQSELKDGHELVHRVVPWSVFPITYLSLVTPYTASVATSEASVAALTTALVGTDHHLVAGRYVAAVDAIGIVEIIDVFTWRPVMASAPQLHSLGGGGPTTATGGLLGAKRLRAPVTTGPPAGRGGDAITSRDRSAPISSMTTLEEQTAFRMTKRSATDFSFFMRIGHCVLGIVAVPGTDRRVERVVQRTTTTSTVEPYRKTFVEGCLAVLHVGPAAPLVQFLSSRGDVFGGGRLPRVAVSAQLFLATLSLRTGKLRSITPLPTAMTINRSLDGGGASDHAVGGGGGGGDAAAHREGVRQWLGIVAEMVPLITPLTTTEGSASFAVDLNRRAGGSDIGPRAGGGATWRRCFVEELYRRHRLLPTAGHAPPNASRVNPSQPLPSNVVISDWLLPSSPSGGGSLLAADSGLQDWLLCATPAGVVVLSTSRIASFAEKGEAPTLRAGGREEDAARNDAPRSQRDDDDHAIDPPFTFVVASVPNHRPSSKGGKDLMSLFLPARAVVGLEIRPNQVLRALLAAPEFELDAKTGILMATAQGSNVPVAAHPGGGKVGHDTEHIVIDVLRCDIQRSSTSTTSSVSTSLFAFSDGCRLTSAEGAMLRFQSSLPGRLLPPRLATKTTVLPTSTTTLLTSLPGGGVAHLRNRTSDGAALPTSAVIVTNTAGSVTLKLFPELSPKTVANFAGLCKEKFYDGLTFHRIIPNFMIQGGCPNGDGTGGRSIYGGPFADEFPADGTLPNMPVFSLCMANRGPNTNESQFFISTAPTPWLRGKHTVFGTVTGGHDNVRKMERAPTVAGDKPRTPILIVSIRCSLDV